MLKPRRWSLRARLLVGQVLLLVIVVVGIGAVTEFALRQFLVHQLDTELIDVQKRSLGDVGGGPSLGPRPSGQPSMPPPPPPPSGSGPGPDFLDRRGIQPDTIGAIVNQGSVSKAGRIDADGTQRSLSHTAQQQLAAVPANEKPVDVALDGQGRYRVVADTSWSGEIVVTGMPLTAVDATLLRVLLILGIVTAIVSIIALLRSASGSSGMRSHHWIGSPATAARVADLELDRGEVVLPVRVPAADADPRTEVGQLGSAVNRMLDHITSALSARHDSETRVRQFLADASHEVAISLTYSVPCRTRQTEDRYQPAERVM